MDRFESSIDIDAPASVCYERWHQFESFPHFMKNVKSVTRQEGTRWHWVVTGPLGTDVSWDAEIDADERNRTIAWHTVPDSEIQMQGATRFDEVAPNRTRVSCFIQYQVSGGGLKEAIAHLIENPHKKVEEDLQNFKHLVEGTHIPASKVHQGKVLTPDPDVIPSDAGTVAGTMAGAAGISRQEGAYEGPYGLDDEIPALGSSAELEDIDIDAETLSLLRNEEDPYLGASGALYSEDLIDQRAEGETLVETDVFTESMDVNAEDLESFTEDLDSDIDAGLTPPRSAT
jgi:hypothetical protein